MKKHVLRRVFTSICCILLVAILALPVAAHITYWSYNSIVIRRDGYFVSIDLDDHQWDRTDTFRKMNVFPEGENLFKNARHMLPGGNASDYVFLRQDTAAVKKERENNRVKGEVGLVFLEARLPSPEDYALIQGQLGESVRRNQDIAVAEELLHEMEITITTYDVAAAYASTDVSQLQAVNVYQLKIDGCEQNTPWSACKAEKTDQSFNAGGSVRDKIYLGFMDPDISILLKLDISAPLSMGNKFENQDGTILWDFYYVPGTIKEFEEIDPSGTSTPDKNSTLHFIRDETPATHLPNIIILGKDDPLGNLPQTGGGSPFALTTRQTVAIFIVIMLLGFFILDAVGKKKKRNPKGE